VILPQVEQIRGRIEDSDPLHLIAGNPSVKRSIKHDVTIQERFNYTSKFFLSASIGITSAPIVPKISYFPSKTALPQYEDYQVPEGAYLSSYDNADYSLDVQVLLNTFLSEMKLFGKNTSLRMYPQVSLSIAPRYCLGRQSDHLSLLPTRHTSVSPDRQKRHTDTTGMNWEQLKLTKSIQP